MFCVKVMELWKMSEASPIHSINLSIFVFTQMSSWSLQATKSPVAFKNAEEKLWLNPRRCGFTCTFIRLSACAYFCKMANVESVEQSSCITSSFMGYVCDRMESNCSLRCFSPLYVHITTDTVCFSIRHVCLGQKYEIFCFYDGFECFLFRKCAFLNMSCKKMKFYLEPNVNIVIFDVEY